jgi:hypothetical protein
MAVKTEVNLGKFSDRKSDIVLVHLSIDRCFNFMLFEI